MLWSDWDENSTCWKSKLTLLDVLEFPSSRNPKLLFPSRRNRSFGAALLSISLSKLIGGPENQEFEPPTGSAGTTDPRMPQGRSCLYLWAAALASSTPAECIQERTASGSSFRLAGAPRGPRVSWIPNMCEEPKLQGEKQEEAEEAQVQQDL